jgi:hypothetical protein
MSRFDRAVDVVSGSVNLIPCVQHRWNRHRRDGVPRSSDRDPRPREALTRGRIRRPDEVASVAFLLSDNLSHLTKEIVDLTAGS